MAKPLKLIELLEFEDKEIPLSALMRDGRFMLDERSQKYIKVKVTGSTVRLQADRFVGTFPVSDELYVLVTPRTKLTSLSFMLARSGEVPSAIQGFSGRYLPDFVASEHAARVYGPSLVADMERIVRRGLVKEYSRNDDPSPWRGRFRASETVTRWYAKGIRFKHVFDQIELSVATTKNMALKAATVMVRDWYAENAPKSQVVRRANQVLRELGGVPSWEGHEEVLSRLLFDELSCETNRSYRLDRGAQWLSFAILQGALPNVEKRGTTPLDSLIIDVSRVFEGFVRRELGSQLEPLGFTVLDGNEKDNTNTFFADVKFYEVHPDIIVRRQAGAPVVIDVKYKLNPDDRDRYELLSFMDAFEASVGAFICPAVKGSGDKVMGTTRSHRTMHCLRFDLAAHSLAHESGLLGKKVAGLAVS
ncbi:MAG: McrC family protein [Propionibacteriaceae bacterium]|nr:McrC family protein [Propionibacteriaceae bacterium]